jgi:hypothetical protein
MAFQLNGTATTIPNGIQLTDDISNQAGSAFLLAKKPYGGFIVDFDYLVTSTDPEPADGFTFTLQNSDAGATSLGFSGFNLGYANTIIPSFAFATSIFNRNSGVKFGQNGEFIGNRPIPGFFVLVGVPIHYHITYDGITFSVTMSQKSQPDFPIELLVDLSTLLEGDGLAFVGFTGSTGIFTARHQITNFSFRSQIPCLHKNTLVSTLVNNKIVVMRPIHTLRANDIVKDINDSPVELINNIRFGTSDKFIRLSKGCLGPNLPTENLLIRKEHPILVEGKEILPGTLLKTHKGVSVVHVPRSHVYSLLTKERTFVMMQGIPVCTWAPDILMKAENKYTFTLL